MFGAYSILLKEVPMLKGGFNMYLVKEKSSKTLYKGYTPKSSKYQDIEVQAYMANIIGNDVSNRMKTTVRYMSTMIAQGFLRRDE